MGIPVLILGESGSGKTSSLRNFGENEVFVINVAAKPLPFRKKLLMYKSKDFNKIRAIISKDNCNCYVIDDSQYLMAFELFDKAKETGYNKFTDIAVHFKQLIDTVVNTAPDDTIVYFLHHIEQSESNGKIKAKTVGKMLDNQLTLEGLFSVCLMARTDGKKHWFETQSDGLTPTKSPMEMFETMEIDNDLKVVDDTIRQYWELAPRKKIIMKGDKEA